MKQLKRELQVVTRDLKRLSQKTDNIIQQLERLDKTQRARALRAKKTEKVPKIDPTLANIMRRKIYPTDIVLAHIIGNRDGIDLATLEKKTGFKYYTIKNIIHRLRTMGKITSSRKEDLKGPDYLSGGSRALYFVV